MKRSIRKRTSDEATSAAHENFRTADMLRRNTIRAATAACQPPPPPHHLPRSSRWLFACSFNGRDADSYRNEQATETRALRSSCRQAYPFFYRHVERGTCGREAVHDIFRHTISGSLAVGSVKFLSPGSRPRAMGFPQHYTLSLLTSELASY